MLLALVIVLLIVVLALAWMNHGIFTVTQNQAAHMTVIESIRAELKMAQERSRKRLAYGWYDDGWPVVKCDEEDRAPLKIRLPSEALTITIMPPKCTSQNTSPCGTRTNARNFCGNCVMRLFG